MPKNIELTRFKVKEGKSEKVDEWMTLLNNNKDKILSTLEDEKMYVETIFREVLDGHEYLYWYSIQGQGGAAVEESQHEIDQLHLAFWKECIDSDYQPIDLKTEVVMIQENVLAQMK